MSLSTKQLQQILAEIGDLLTGGVLQKIDQPQPWSLIFEIHQKGKRFPLYFSGHRSGSRFHLLTERYPNPTAPPRFCQLLRAHLRWKRILSIQQMGEDRIIQMTCTWTGPQRTSPLGTPGTDATDAPAVSFVAELIGPASNFFLLDTHRVILGSLFPPHSSRPLKDGMKYQPPPLHHSLFFKEEPIPLTEAASFQFNQSVERYYRTLEEKEEKAERKRRYLSAIDREMGRCNKKLKQLATALAEAQRSEEYRLYGELLKSHLHEIKPGMTELRCPNPTNLSQLEVVLPLDPALSPSGNLERFFKKYKKAQSARSTLHMHIERTERELERLEKNRQTADHPPPLPKMGRKARQQKSGAPAFLSADGLTLIVGRNDRENEEVTFRIARGNDIWFHARGLSGAHLIVRMERGQELPYQTLFDAATLALHFSDGRKAGKGDVLYTFRKYVQKPKKGRPGSILCSQDKNIYIEIEPARLERILESRINPSESDY